MNKRWDVNPRSVVIAHAHDHMLESTVFNERVLILPTQVEGQGIDLV